MLSKVALERIPSLTFYKDALTLSKRGDPIPQLTCVGKACRLYEPDVVRCVNAGGHGTDVDWRVRTVTSLAVVWADGGGSARLTYRRLCDSGG